MSTGSSPRAVARAGARQHHRVRPDAALHARRAAARRACASCCIRCRRFARCAKAARGGVRGDPPRGHAEERRRRACRRARSCTTCSATTSTRGSSIELFARQPRSQHESTPPRPLQTRRNPSRCRACRPATPRSAPSGAPATTCTTAATTSSRSPSSCEFEEIAYLLIHGKLPNARRARRLQGASCKALRGLPAARARGARGAARRGASDGRAAHRRLGARAARCRRRTTTASPGARDIADRLIASLGSMLAYWYHFSHTGERIDVETDDDSVGGALPAPAAPASRRRRVGAGDAHLAHPVRRARVQRLDLHRARDRRHRRRHLLVHHRRDRRAARPKHGGANEVALEIQQRYADAGRGRGGHPRARREQGGHHRLRPPGLHRRRSAQRGDQGSRAAAVARRPATCSCFDDRRAHRGGDARDQEDVLRTSTGSPPSPTTCWACRPRCSRRCS